MSKAWKVGLPSTMESWRFSCFVFEIFVDTFALGLAVFVIHKIIFKIRLHWNLKFLSINVFIMIILTMASRIPLAVNALVNFINESTEITFSLIHDCCICASAFIQFIMAIERTVATICASNYERVHHKFWCIIGLGLAWCGQLICVFCMRLGWINIVENVIIFLVFDIAAITIYIYILRKNYIQQICLFISKPLSEQYQILENLRSIRPLVILIILQLFHNCFINALMLIMIFYIEPTNNVEMHAILDVVFNTSTAILFCCFSFPFFILKNTKRENWNPLYRRQSILYRNNRIYSITSTDSLDNTDIHFRQLVSVWM